MHDNLTLYRFDNKKYLFFSSKFCDFFLSVNYRKVPKEYKF